jgi:phosphoglycolate phosphatase-like HAD superfamily hydrolase
VPPAERIAAFDNDGTLWTEQPVYCHALFVRDRIKALAPEHPEWETKEPYASLLKGDMKAVMADGEKALQQLFIVTHTGMTSDEFSAMVSDWIATARHTETGRQLTDMTYQPMRELLADLRANGFKAFIVSGGGMSND